MKNVFLQRFSCKRHQFKLVTIVIIQLKPQMGLFSNKIFSLADHEIDTSY